MEPAFWAPITRKLGRHRMVALSFAATHTPASRWLALRQGRSRNTTLEACRSDHKPDDDEDGGDGSPEPKASRPPLPPTGGPGGGSVCAQSEAEGGEEAPAALSRRAFFGHRSRRRAVG